MELYMFTGTLLLVLGADGGATERCPAPGRTSMKLCITSLRNLTGHWIVSVDAVTELPRQATSPNSPVEVAIDVGHGAVSSEHTETVRLTATAAAAVRGVTAPPAGYEVVNGLGYYKMHTNALTWEQAREYCVQEGTRLIILNSDREAEVAKTLLKRDKSKIRGTIYKDGVFAGFHDSTIEGEYTTVLGEPLANSGYTRWHNSTEHNNTVYNFGAIHEGGYLLLLPGDRKYAFICELIAQ